MKYAIDSPGFDLSKGTIRFTVEKALPDDVVRDVVRLRVAEINSTTQVDRRR